MMTPLFIGGIGMQEVLLIALVVLLFFGGRKIPELMKGIGKGVRSFKEGMNGLENEIAGEPMEQREQDGIYSGSAESQRRKNEVQPTKKKE